LREEFRDSSSELLKQLEATFVQYMHEAARSCRCLQLRQSEEEDEPKGKP
jgi:hypothetical protein